MNFLSEGDFNPLKICFVAYIHALNSIIVYSVALCSARDEE